MRLFFFKMQEIQFGKHHIDGVHLPFKLFCTILSALPRLLFVVSAVLPDTSNLFLFSSLFHQYAKTGMETPGILYHMNNVNGYLGRQGGRKAPIH